MTRTRFNRAGRRSAALHDAAQAGNLKAAAAALQNDAGAADTDDNGDTALHIAARRADRAMMALLLSYGPGCIDAPDRGGHTALTAAAARGDTDTLRFLLDHGAGLDAPAASGDTPLMQALAMRQYAALDLLARAGAAIGQTDSDHKNVLHRAAAANDVRALDILLAAGGAAHVQDRMPSGDRHTPLHAAASAGAEDAVRVLIAAGANPNIPDALNMTPLHTAAARDDAGMIYTLVCEGHAEINRVENPAGYTALHTAVINKAGRALRALCDLGADPHQMDADRRTPLNIAGWNGFLDAARYLMEDIPPEVDDGAALQSRTQALYDALFYDHAEVAEYLIASGKVDMNRTTYGGEYVLQAALQGGKSDMAEKIIAAGADVNVRNPQGMSPLLLCATRNLVVPAVLLLQKGARPDFGPLSAPPLHTAIEKDHPFMVTLLLDHGANPLQTDSFGRIAIDLARQKGRANMIPDLERAQQKFTADKQPAPPAPGA